jgi:hypothetical protein
LLIIVGGWVAYEVSCYSGCQGGYEEYGDYGDGKFEVFWFFGWGFRCFCLL